jgi:hypothetical protein
MRQFESADYHYCQRLIDHDFIEAPRHALTLLVTAACHADDAMRLRTPRATSWCLRGCSLSPRGV